MHASQPSSAARRHIAVVLALLASLLAVVGGMGSSAATAASLAPVSLSVDTVASDRAAPDGTPDGAVPTVIVKTGERVHVTVSFSDSTGAPASFQKDTKVVVTSSGGGLSQVTSTVSKGVTSAVLDVTFSQTANQVALTVTVPGKAGTSISATSSSAQRFDVLSELRFVDAAPGINLRQGIGGDDSRCTNATPTNPVCGIVMLPNGATGTTGRDGTPTQVLLSLGLCGGDYSACGSPKGAVVQTLTGLSGLYARTAPAALLMKCDKTLCGGGQIQDQHLNFSLAGNAELQPAPACPAKATVGADQHACVDYVQSKRDGSGDTLLYLLFTQDMRGSVG